MLLNIEDLCVRYAVRELIHNFSFHIDRGEIKFLRGPNGVGKTTIFKSLMGLITPSAGKVYFEGEDITFISTEERVRRGIGYAPQGGGIFRSLSVLENIEMGAYIRRDKKNVLRDIDWIYSLFPELKVNEGVSASDLSSGQKQMLAISMVLVKRPKVLLLDEPSLGLDPVHLSKVASVIERLRKDEGIAFFIIEHGEAARYDLRDSKTVFLK